LLVLWALRGIANRLVHRRFHNDTMKFYSWRKLVSYSFMVLVIVLIGRLWLAGWTTLVTYLGLVSAGLAIALQDLIVSLAGWAFIIWRRPFEVGDRIEISGHMGDVIDLRLFAFSILAVGGYSVYAEQSTGRIIHIPNGTVFKEPVMNTHQGVPYVWNEIQVMVTFESDWEKAKKILNNIILELAPDVEEGMAQYKKRADRFVISYSNLAPTIYTSVADSGVVLTMRYLVEPRKRRGSQHAIWEAILRAFALHWDIDFAYPTQREYLHFEERQLPPDPQEAETIVSKRPPLDPDTGYRPRNRNQ
jgi:small-conductance mechanosensitive channel